MFHSITVCLPMRASRGQRSGTVPVIAVNVECLGCGQIVHGTDTLAYTASALSLMLAGFRKPIVITGRLLTCLM